MRITITGSQADLLRAGLNSDMMGRTYVLNLKPLSFLEFLEFRRFLGAKLGSDRSELSKYITFGGYPEVVYQVLHAFFYY